MCLGVSPNNEAPFLAGVSGGRRIAHLRRRDLSFDVVRECQIERLECLPGASREERFDMPRKAPVPPTSDMLERIKHEVADPKFLADLIKWADRQCGRLLSIEDRVEPNKAIELVNAAVIDTCDGVRVWHPEARTLRRHLEQTINSRLWHECDRMRRRRFVPLAPATDESQDGIPAVEYEMTAQREDPRQRPDAQLAQREVRAKVYAALRERAARDTELVALLDAYESGHNRQADAEARVGLHGQAFQNLVRRFKTIRAHIPADLRGAALDVIVSDGGAPLEGAARRGFQVDLRAGCRSANDSADSVAGLEGDASSDLSVVEDSQDAA